MKSAKASRLQGYVINTTSFVAQFAIQMVNLALVYYLRLHFNLSAQMIGLSAGVYTAAYFVFCIVLGPLHRHMRPRHSVELSVLGMALSIFLVIMTEKVFVVFIALIAYGFFMSFLWPQIETWFARGKEGRELNRATSAFNVSWSLGAALSPLVTGFLVGIDSVIPLRIAIILFSSVYILILVATHLVPEIKAVASENVAIAESNQIDQSTPLRFLSWAQVVTIYISIAVTMTIFPLFALDFLPFSESKVGSLLLIRGLVTVVMFVILGKTSWWHFNRKLIVVVLLSSSLLFFVGTKIVSFAAYSLFFLLFGILFSFSYSFSIFHGASGAVHRSKRMLIHEALLTLGNITGSIMGGTLYEKFSFTTVLYACSIFVLLPVLGSLIVQLYKKGAQR